MMTLEKAADILRSQKFKLTKPKDKKMLPKYMLTWSDEKIDKYYDEQKDLCAAIDLAIRTLHITNNFKKASYDLVDIFDNLDTEGDK
jgi:hypothetical protein